MTTPLRWLRYQGAVFRWFISAPRIKDNTDPSVWVMSTLAWQGRRPNRKDF